MVGNKLSSIPRLDPRRCVFSSLGGFKNRVFDMIPPTLATWAYHCVARCINKLCYVRTGQTARIEKQQILTYKSFFTKMGWEILMKERQLHQSAWKLHQSNHSWRNCSANGLDRNGDEVCSYCELGKSADAITEWLTTKGNCYPQWYVNPTAWNWTYRTRRANRAARK